MLYEKKFLKDEKKVGVESFLIGCENFYQN